MNATTQFLLLLGILIFAAKVGGLISTQLGQPAVLGELLVGLLLGPTALDLLHNPSFAAPTLDPFILDVGELGVVFLMFVAGLEIDLAEMVHSGKVALLTGSLGALVSLVLGTLTALFFHFPVPNSIFAGLILTATSVSISAQTLMELGVIQSKGGLALLGAAVVDDVLGLLLLSIFLAFAQGPTASPHDIAVVLVRAALFFALAIVFGLVMFPPLTRWIGRLPVSEGVLAFVVTITLFYAWSAQVVGGIAPITGAFIAGSLFGRTHVRRAIAGGMHTLTYSFFVPIFLISVGLRANVRTLDGTGLLFAGAIVLVAIIGKIVGCGLGARLANFSPHEALRVGVGMISRSEVTLIIAAVGVQQAWIDQNVYSAMILVVLVTTLVTPIFLKRVFPKPAREAQPAVSVADVVDEI